MNPLLLPAALALLETEFGLLHLLYHRNKNQHRVAVWWRRFSIVHRDIRKLIEHIHGSTEEKKIVQRERRREQALDLAAHMIRSGVFTKAYYDFNSVIALGQFIALGMVLVACLSKLHGLVLEMDGLRERLRAAKPTKTRVVEKTADVAEEFGEEIVVAPAAPLKRPLDMDDIFSVRKDKKAKKEKRDKTKKSKPKKKKSAIDDIFS